MSGKKKIAYPIELPFKTEEPFFYHGAENIYDIHKDLVDLIINSLNGKLRVGYVKRDREKSPNGINAHSLNEALRDKLNFVPEIHTETNVVFGTFLPSHAKSDFDFSIYDKETNFFNFWNHCYGKDVAVYDGDSLVDSYIVNEVKEEWDIFIEKNKPRKHEDYLEIPNNVFNIIGEIQFGNWAMVYKDMFRLVSAINNKAKIDLYIYIAASGNLKKLMSDGVVGVEDAKKRFQENVDNHNINKPVIIIPLNVDFDVEGYDFSDAVIGYEEICKQLDKIEKSIDRTKKKIKELQNEKKTTKGKDNISKIKTKIDQTKGKRKNLEEQLTSLKNQYRDAPEFDEE